ncbi:MAG: N-methyl-L-tryptophan oxidase [Pseudomonadota bacterium]
MADHFDCIVVGTGGIGSQALYALAARGARVLGIDQYEIAHDRGSSHGDTRAIRLVYFEHPDYVPLLQRAFELWADLEKVSGQTLLARTGILQAGPAGEEVISGMLAAAAQHQLPMDQLSSTDASTRFDGFALPVDHAAIFDPSGGILFVEDCVRTAMAEAVKAGASVQIPERMLNWHAGPTGRLIVETDRGRYTADRLVITPGPFARQALPELAPHLHLLRKALFWFEPGDACYQLENGCPAFLFEQGHRTFYGFPAMDSKGIKIAEHSGGRPLSAPEALDRHVDTNELEAVTLALKNYLPRAGHQLNHHTTCMYTMSPDGHFIVGPYPGFDNVHVVAGLSGHGFKFATVLGEIMADLSLEGSTRHAIDFLSPLRLPGMH